MVLQNNSESANANSKEERQRRRRKRWGNAPGAPAASTMSDAAALSSPSTSLAGVAPRVPVGTMPLTSVAAVEIGTGTGTGEAAEKVSTSAKVAKVLAMQESIRLRLASAKAKQKQQQQKPQSEREQQVLSVSARNASAAPTAKTSGTVTTSTRRGRKRFALAEQAPGTAVDNKNRKPAVKRAKHYELDLSVTAPSFSSLALKGEKRPENEGKINPYLVHALEENKQNKKVAPSTSAETDHQQQENTLTEDTRIVRAAKPRVRRQQLKFSEPGHWQGIADKQRERAAAATAAGFVSGRKTGHSVKALGMGDYYSWAGTGAGTYTTADGDSEKDFPLRAEAAAGEGSNNCLPVHLIEWWDMDLLPSKLRKRVTSAEKALFLSSKKQSLTVLSATSSEGPAASASASAAAADSNPETVDEKKYQTTLHNLQRLCWEEASLSYSKTATLVQHIVPIKPAHLAAAVESFEKKQAVLHLTKKERKRQKKLRRQAAAARQQDLQAAGLVTAPEPRLTLQNFFRVLGDQAYTDPSQMEKKVQEQMQARLTAHLERNAANKLTKEQRAAKRAAKLQEDTSQGVSVALFWVLDLSHPYHRAVVDLNAQQYNLTGGVLECVAPAAACVVVEGGPKAIRKYTRLMVHRIAWEKGPDGDDDEEGETAVSVACLADGSVEGEDQTPQPAHKFNPNNTAALIWQGSSVKRAFRGFMFQAVGTAEQARQILAARGCGHYWDAVMQHVQQHASGQTSTLSIKLASLSDGRDTSDSDSEDATQKRSAS